MQPQVAGAALAAALAGLLLQGCGEAPPAAKPPPTREDILVEMVCSEAVEDAIDDLKDTAMEKLKKSCLEKTNAIENLPKGKYVVQDKCEHYGQKHIGEAHEVAKAPLLQNCTRWAAVKMEDKAADEEKSTKLKDLLVVASESLDRYVDSDPDGIAYATGLYDEAISQAIESTKKLIVSIKEKARKTMNDQLKAMDKEEELFEDPGRSLAGANGPGAALPAAGLVAAGLAALAAGAALPALRRARRGRDTSAGQPLAAELEE